MHTTTVLIGVFGAMLLVFLVIGIVASSRGKSANPGSNSGYIPGVTDGTVGDGGHHHHHDGGGHHGDSGGHGGFSDGGGGAHSAH